MQEATDEQSRKERPKREVGVYDGDRRSREGETDMSRRMSSLWRHSDLVYDGGLPQGKQSEDASQEKEEETVVVVAEAKPWRGVAAGPGRVKLGVGLSSACLLH